MHVAPANNSGKCMMNYGSEILCRDNGMRNCGPQPYLKIFQNIFRVVLVDGGKRLAIAPCHAHLLMTANFRPYISISISSVLGCCRKSDQRVVLTPYLARPKQDPSFYTLTCFQPLNLWKLRMVSLTISAAAKPPAFARSFPLTIDVKPDATVGEVKAAITIKFPKVRPNF